jgi:phytoene synthase
MTVQIDAWESSLLSQAYAPLEVPRRAHVAPLGGHADYRSAYQACRVITREHSRTFYLASSLLPAEQRPAMRALYAFCRVSDDLVDRHAPNRAVELAAWRLRALGDHPGEDPVALAWADTRARFHIPRQYAEQLLDGIAGDLTRTRYDTFDELTHYCYAVASTVGLMVMHIVGFSGKEAVPYAVKLGVALQITNILRDVGEDWENGRLYLPQSELVAFDLSEADVARGVVDDRWRALMRFQIARARRLFGEALPGVALLSRGGRLAIGAAAELYRAILDDIESHDYDVFNRRAYTSDGRKLALLPGIWWRSRSGAVARRHTFT